MFAASLPAYEQKLRDALSEGGATALRDHAHDLAGAAAYCGAAPLYRVARQLDEVAADAGADELATLVGRILAEIGRLAAMRLDRFE